MQTHQYLSTPTTNDSRPASFHQENLVGIGNGTGVVYRVAHPNGVARPPSRQSSFHNRLSYRAFGSPPSTSTNVTTQSTGFAPSLTNSAAMTTSWPNNGGGTLTNNGGTLTNNGWINLALDSPDPYHNHHLHHQPNDVTLEKTYSQKRQPLQNGTASLIGHSGSGAATTSLPRTGSVKHDSGKSRVVPESRLVVSNQQIYSAILSLFIIGFPACIISILALQLLISLSLTVCVDSFSSSDTSTVLLQSNINQILRDLAVGLCTVSLATSVTSILSSFLQCYLCLKCLKTTNESKIRILLYLRSNVYLRMFIDGGFFIGLVCFLLSVIIYIHLLTNVTGTPSVTSTIVTVIVGLAIILCLAVMVHGAYSWLCGRLSVNNKTLSDSAIYEKKNKKQLDINKNLSTLV